MFFLRPHQRTYPFRVMAVLVGCLPWMMVEVGLRWIRINRDGSPISQHDGFESSELFTRSTTRPAGTADANNSDEPRGAQSNVPESNNRRDLTNPTVRWEISPKWSNYFCHASFSEPKPESTKRIFVLGGSTVQGRPYATETAFAKFLELRLNSANSKWHHEVINCGGVSYASDRVERILREVLTHQPDAIVLYTGHNEFLEDREFHRNPHLFRWIADHSYTIQFIQQNFLARSSADNASESYVDLQTRLDREGGMASYQRDPVWRQKVHDRFAVTVQRMVRRCRRETVPLVVCVPASDWVQTPPFKVDSEPSTLEESGSGSFPKHLTPTSRTRDLWQRLTQAIDHEPTSVSQRIRWASAIIEIDPEHAGAHYVLGRIGYETDPTQESLSDRTRRHLMAARDFDVCPLRATSSIESTVRDLARRYRDDALFHLVDVADALDRPPSLPNAAPDGVPDPGWFADHVHPTIGGHRRIAVLLSDVFERWDWIESSDRSNERFRDACHEHLQSLGEDYYQRGQQRLEGLRQWAAGRAGSAGSFGLP